MKIAIVGGGVAGLYAAWHLSGRHDVTLFEADDRLGGHADSHAVEDAGSRLTIDSGFIVFNERNYPLFTEWLGQLGVAAQDSDMSFGVRDAQSGLEYNAASLNRLFCQRRNLVSPAFYGMLRDIVRFYRQAGGLLETVDDRETLGQWLARSGLGSTFAELHLIPMASALWSAPVDRVSDFPMRHLLAFMDNHAMLQLGKRPKWRTVSGGSRAYVEAASRCGARFCTGSPVRGIRRRDRSIRLRLEVDEADFDAVIMACHSDQALALLDDPSPLERSVLAAIGFQANDVLLHTDVSALPRNPNARAAWNVVREAGDSECCRVSYYMNRLQNIASRHHYIVSLNQEDRVHPDRVLARRRYHHPVFTPAAVAAQGRWRDINGLRNTWFCGAWWGWGFHEDAVRSARWVIDDLDIRHA